MVISSTKICNLALIELGQKRITDITEDSDTARYCNEIYEQERNEALTDGPEKGWKFARHRESVAIDATAPEFEFDYRFAVPSDPPCLQVVSVQVGGVEVIDWIREEDYILTNEEDAEVDITYIKEVTDEAKFPTHFVKYLAAKMAVKLAYRVAQNVALGERLEEKLEKRIRPRAIAKDNLEIYVEDENHDWIDTGHAD